MLVLFDHTLVSFRGYSNGSFLSEFGSAVGSLGVNVFFVLSGFLITMLLLRERAVSGRIDLRRFYVRRTQRIFPAFYIYLAIVGALCTFGTLAQIRPFDLAFDFLYLHNFGLGVGNWYVGQTWSLDIEEQFYLVWPAIAILGWRFSTRFAIASIVAEPIVRTAAYVLLPHVRGFLPISIFTRADLLMFGCAAALLLTHGRAFGAWFSSDRARKLLAVECLALGVSLVLDARFRGVYTLTVGYAIDGALVSAILLTVVRQPACVFARFLGLGMLGWIGRISYSLYLWQQLFFTPFRGSILQRFPFDLGAALLCGFASYLLIERRFLRKKPAFEVRQAIESF